MTPGMIVNKSKPAPSTHMFSAAGLEMPAIGEGQRFVVSRCARCNPLSLAAAPAPDRDA